MFHGLFQNITNKDKASAVEELITHSTPNNDFFLMVVLSVLMATFGLLTNSSAVIVGSMLIAPILYPILSLAMGIIMSDLLLIKRALNTLAKAIILIIGAAAVVTVIFSPEVSGYTPEILSRTTPSLLFGAIGVVAGLAASFALVKPKLSATLPGVAISVALIPPLSVIGIGIANFDTQIIMGALLIFTINAIGVIFTGMIVFSLMNFYAKRELAEQVVKKEEKALEHEEHKKEEK
ncbi:MAG: DUF389 domain-containing protein [Candidatus Azambacteria bacterium]|nr:DUF389 domain-containing protein [Candidatus Azambacteria bacterium]